MTSQFRHIRPGRRSISYPVRLVSVTALTTSERPRRTRIAVTSTPRPSTVPPTGNTRLIEWVERWAAVLQPDRIHWCDGSDAEHDALTAGLVASGTFDPVNAELRPNSFYARSDPGDV